MDDSSLGAFSKLLQGSHAHIKVSLHSGKSVHKLNMYYVGEQKGGSNSAHKDVTGSVKKILIVFPCFHV